MELRRKSRKFAAKLKEKVMARGDSWKTRNRTNAVRGLPSRIVKKRVLNIEPQFKAEDLYISPFSQKKRYDEDGRWQYVAIERKETLTGIRLMDDYLRYIAAGGKDESDFAEKRGLKVNELHLFILIFTGVHGVRFRQLYQMRLVDDLLRYTNMSPAEVAKRSGLGSPNNMYLALRREYNMSATERRNFLRKAGDVGHYRI